MPSGNGAAYRVSHLPAAQNEMMEMGQRAAQQGMLQKYSQVLIRAMKRLGTRPVQWGEARYHPKKPGSTVNHASIGGLVFEYVVFENEREVVILNVKPLPGSPWHE